MERDRLTVRWAVRGRDIEMKTIFRTFFFLELQTHTHTAVAVAVAGRLTVSDRHAYRLKKKKA